MLLADTKQNVIDILNASGLPIDAIYYVMREVMFEIEQTYNKVLQQEKEALEKAKKDAENKEKRPITKEEAFELNKQYEEKQEQLNAVANEGILSETREV